MASKPSGLKNLAAKFAKKGDAKKAFIKGKIGKMKGKEEGKAHEAKESKEEETMEDGKGGCKK